MRWFEKENTKKIIIYVLVITAIFLILSLFINFIALQIMSKNISNPDKLFLQEYGFDKKDLYMLENANKTYNAILVINLGITAVFGATLIIFFIKQDLRKDKEISKITDYIKEINKKNYKLLIEHNDEGELSLLRNEIYKTVVFLKEQSELAITDKLSLKDSISDISHQLKTPLTSIMIMLDNIIDNKNIDKNRAEEFLNDIKKQTTNISFLISSLLKLSRLDSNVIKFTKTEVNAKELVVESLKNLETLIKSKNIEINIQENQNTIFYGDYKWQLEAITNIIKNGIEHSNNNSKISIHISKTATYTKITIEDYGKGIDKTDLKHIFDRFYKGKNSSNDSIGIGLALAKRIIEQDNGYIKVESEIDRGTKFTIMYMNCKISKPVI